MNESAARIFIVEDEALIQMEIKDRLIQFGYIVCGAAARGEIAVGQIVEAAPDLVLMDVKLAGAIDGIETARRLRELCDRPVVFLSAYSDNGLLGRAVELGSFGYLVKPFEARELHATIQMAIYKNRMERDLQEAKARLEDQVRERTEQLAASERRFADFARIGSDWLWETDAAGRFVYVSSNSSSRRLDYQARIGQTRQEGAVQDPENLARLEALREITARCEPFRNITYQTLDRNRRPRWCSINGEPMFDSGGTLLGYRGVGSDISALKAAELTLKEMNATLEQRVAERTMALVESERFNRETLDAMEAHLAVLDAEGQILATNAAWRRFAARDSLDWQQVVDGANYLNACDRATGPGAADARVIAAGIRDVVAGRRDGFTHEYLDQRPEGQRPEGQRPEGQRPEGQRPEGQRPEGQRPEGQRWLLCHVSRFFAASSVRVVVAHDDVTPVHAALERATVGERLLTVLADVSPIGIFRTDAAGDCVEVNQRWLEIAGLTREEAMGDGWARALHPEDRPRVVDAWVAAARDHVPFQDEYRFQRPDGSIVWVIGNSRSILSPDGVVTGHVGTITDMTERKQVELAMQAISTELITLEGQAYYQLAARRLAEILDADIAFIARLDPARPGEVQTVAMIEDGAIVPNVRYPVVGTPCARVVAGGAAYVVERDVQQQYPDDVFLVEKAIDSYAAAPLLDQGGRVVGHIGVLKRAPLVDGNSVARTLKIYGLAVATEKIRDRNRRQYQDLFEFAPDALVLSNQEGRIVLVNRRAEAIFGWTRAELAGQAVEMLVPRESRAVHQGLREQHVKQPEARRMASNQQALQARRKDGSVFPVEIDLAPVETESGTMIAAAIRDVTERQALEEQLAQATKMEALGKLTGGMAHDFNNYLAVIIGNLEMLKDAIVATPDSQELIDAALEGAERGAALTQSLLAFSRQQPLDPRTTDINQRLAGITSLLQRTIGEDIEIVTSFDEKLWKVTTDAALMDSAIVNLANNARDAMPRGGTLTIVTRNTHLGEDHAQQHPGTAVGDYALVEVSDTGEGMPPTTLARAFDPFFTTKAAGHGSGLGLSMVYGFVKQSGGHIAIASDPGHGTTVRIYLPRASATGSTAEPATPTDASRPAGSETILVVEDNEHMRRTVVAQLLSLGYQVLAAENGDMALRILDQREPRVDLLFTDVVMPGKLDGYTLAASAIAYRPGIKILLTSGFPGDALRRDDKQIPDLRLLAKPYRRDELTRAIRAVLDGPPRAAAVEPWLNRTI